MSDTSAFLLTDIYNIPNTSTKNKHTSNLSAN